MTLPFSREFARDLASLWLEAPFVIALRSHAIGMAMMAGNTRGMAELGEMVAEKAAAAAESAVAVNVAMAREGIAAASALALGHRPASPASAAGKIAHAAVKPYSSRVRSNARRLSRKKG